MVQTNHIHPPGSIDIEAVDMEGQECNYVGEDGKSHSQT